MLDRLRCLEDNVKQLTAAITDLLGKGIVHSGREPPDAIATAESPEFPAMPAVESLLATSGTMLSEVPMEVVQSGVCTFYKCAKEAGRLMSGHNHKLCEVGERVALREVFSLMHSFWQWRLSLRISTLL